MSTRELELQAPALKAMAHPLRVQILRILQLRTRASVTSLAAELGETTGSTSYHLRQLARHGFVEPFDPETDTDAATDAATDAVTDPDAPPRSTGRKQRWWRMAVGSIHMTGFEFMADADTREAAGFLLREIHADRSRRSANWYATATQWSPAWQRASSDNDTTLRLNATQTRALADELKAVIDRYAALRPGRGARPVDVQYAVFPADDGTRA